MLTRLYILCTFLWLAAMPGLLAQALTGIETLSGHLDFVWTGQTNNLSDNSEPGFDCASNNVSFSTINLQYPATAAVKKAILYWAGSGSGDFDVHLTGPNFPDMAISAQRTYVTTYVLLPFFAAAYDVTQVVAAAGPGSYTLSQLDAANDFAHCQLNAVYSGWSILVVYEESSLPYSTVEVYEGLDPFRDDSRSLDVDNILISSPANTRVGVQVWEGDSYATTYEHITVNGSALSNALNPDGQVFNGSGMTSDNYNMDLDVYDVSPFVSAGDNSINVTLSTGGDLILWNTMVVRYHEEPLPDAVLRIDTANNVCGTEEIVLSFTLQNAGIGSLPAGTQLVFKAGNAAGAVLFTYVLSSDLPPGDSIVETIQFTAALNFDAIYGKADAPDAVAESDETNNEDSAWLVFTPSGTLVQLSDTICPGDTVEWGGVALYTDTIVADTLQTAAGCDSIVTFQLTVLNLLTDTVHTILCPGQTVLLPDGTAVSAPGVYQTQDSCTHLTVTMVDPDTTAVSTHLPDTVGIAPGDFVTLAVDSLVFSMPHWSSAVPVACDTCFSIQVAPEASALVYFSALNAAGCPVDDTVVVQVRRGEDAQLYIPNAFSPNGDGRNDVFTAYGDAVVEIVRLEIYDRWGSLLWKDENLTGSAGWDGVSASGRMAPEGVYVYVMRVQLADGTIRMYAGDVSLVR